MKINRKKDILNGNIVEQLLLFTFPFCTGYLLQQVYAFVDGIVLGRLVGTKALASVGGSATAIINVMLNFITGLSNGVLVIVAQHYGRRNTQEVSKAVRTGIFMSVLFGGILMVIGFVGAKPILSIMNTPIETIKDSLTYMYFYFASFIPYLIYQVGICILRATGDTKRPLYFIIIQAITKIIFDLLFAGPFKMGVFGTSLATFLSNLICGVLILVLLQFTLDCYRFNIKDFGFDPTSLKQALKIGVPSGIQSAVFALSVLVLQAKINAYGTNAAAALTAYNNVDNLFWAQTNAVGMAVITIVGQNYGNKNYKRVKDVVKYGIIIDLIVCIYMGLVNVFLGKYILLLFSTDKEVLRISAEMLRIVAATYFTYTLVEVISCTCKGIGDMFNSMIISIIGICIVRFAYLIFYPIKSMYGVIVVYPLSWFITGIIYLFYYLFSMKFKEIRTCDGK